MFRDYSLLERHHVFSNELLKFRRNFLPPSSRQDKKTTNASVATNEHDVITHTTVIPIKNAVAT